MSDLKLIEAGCGPAHGFKSVVVLTRRVIRKLIAPWLLRTNDILQVMSARLDAGERNTKILSERLDALSNTLYSLCKDHLELAKKIESRLGPHDSVEDKLSAFQALHWDHVALARRLAAIEDVLAAGGDSARSTLEEGGARPLLPFPGLESPDSRSSKVS